MVVADIDFCSPRDLEELWEVEAECFAQPWDKRIIENDLQNLGTITYVKAVMKGKIAGFAVMTREHAGVHLQSIAVRESYRRWGIATQLLLALGEVAEVWGCKRMWLEVRPSNQAARDFYHGMAFTFKTRVRGYYSDGEDALILLARLPFEIK